MSHKCDRLCHRIAAEQSGIGPTPAWNSLSHIEQAEWLKQEHAWSVLEVIHRVVRAAKVLFT